LKLIASLSAAIFLLIGYVGYSQVERQYLEVDFLDVGQGDAILIKTPAEQNILIDGGPDKQVLTRLGENLSFYDKKLDLVILTHPHSDHVAGLVEVLKRYQVKKILMTGVVHTAPDYLAFLTEIENQNLAVDYVAGQSDIALGDDIKLQLLAPMQDLLGKEVDALNDTSIVSRLVYKNNSFLLTGDAESVTEQELLNQQVDLKSQVLKVGHHGSSTATSKDFLAQVQPQYAVIEVGKDNDFGHPHFKVLNLLQQFKVNILRTDELGTIKLLADGENIKVKAED